MVGAHALNHFVAILARIDDFIYLFWLATNWRVSPIGISGRLLLFGGAEHSNAHMYGGELRGELVVGEDGGVTRDDMIDMAAEARKIKGDEIECRERAVAAEVVSNLRDQLFDDGIDIGIA